MKYTLVNQNERKTHKYDISIALLRFTQFLYFRAASHWID